MDVERDFKMKISATYETQLQEMRNQLRDLNEIVNQNQGIVNVRFNL